MPGPLVLNPTRGQGQAAEDGGQHVVEVVGDAAGELPDALHPLRLAERFLRLDLGGHLMEGLDAENDPPVLITDGRGGHLEHHRRAVGATERLPLAFRPLAVLDGAVEGEVLRLAGRRRLARRV
jgi:hypothetical protein